MNDAASYRDRTNVSIGLILKAPVSDFEKIQRMIEENFPDSFIARAREPWSYEAPLPLNREHEQGEALALTV